MVVARDGWKVLSVSVTGPLQLRRGVVVMWQALLSSLATLGPLPTAAGVAQEEAGRAGGRAGQGLVQVGGFDHCLGECVQWMLRLEKFCHGKIFGRFFFFFARV